MICEKCGAVIEDGHIMCPKCGALVTLGTKNNYGINWDTAPADKVSEPLSEQHDKEDIEDVEVDIVEDIESVETDEELDEYGKHIPARLICLLVLAIIISVGAILKGKSFFEQRKEEDLISLSYDNEWAYENQEESDGRIRYYSFNNGIYDSNGKMYCSKANIDDQKTTVLFNYSNTRCRYIDFSDSKDGESGTLYLCADGEEKSKIAENVCEIYGIGTYGEKDSYYRTKDGEIYSYDDKTCKSTLRYENVMSMAVDELGDSVAYLCEDEGEYVVNYTDEDAVIEIVRGEKKLAPFGISKRYHGNYIFLRDMDNGEIYRFSFSTKEIKDLEINAPKMSDAVFNNATKWLLVNYDGALYWCKPDTKPSIVATNFENIFYANYLVDGFVCTFVADKSIFQYRLEVSLDKYYLNLEEKRDDYEIEDYVVERDGDVVFLSEGSLYWSRYAASDPVEILSDVKGLYPDEGSFNNYTAVVLTEDDEYYLWVDGQLIELDKSPY